MENSSEKVMPDNVAKAERAKAVTTAQKKKKFIKTYASRLCNVSRTCEVVGTSRNTFYRWYDEDDKFKNAVDNEQEKFYDDLETTMYTKAIADKDTTMLIWISKTKMKHRGYVEKVENELSGNAFEDLMKSASKSNDKK